MSSTKTTDTMLSRVIITDHCFPSIHQEQTIVESAGFRLEEIRPICKTEEDVIRACADADVLLVQWAHITRRVMETLTRVKCVVRYGVGVDNIDLKAARELGVTVANVPDYCLEEVSNHALAMILALGRRIPQDHHQIVQGRWGITPFRPIPAFSDMILGLVGFGEIARSVARKADVFGFRVIGFDPYVPDRVFAALAVKRVDWPTLLKTADIISLHCPLVPETTHLINREMIGATKWGVLIVNTARGALVKEADLIEALRIGKVGGAGLDVFEEEPLPARSTLRNFPNVILTSHAASMSEKAVGMLQVKAAEAARDFLLGRLPASTLVDGRGQSSRKTVGRNE